MLSCAWAKPAMEANANAVVIKQKKCVTNRDSDVLRIFTPQSGLAATYALFPGAMAMGNSSTPDKGSAVSVLSSPRSNFGRALRTEP
jgi:hypothetical protein